MKRMHACMLLVFERTANDPDWPSATIDRYFKTKMETWEVHSAITLCQHDHIDVLQAVAHESLTYYDSMLFSNAHGCK